MNINIHYICWNFLKILMTRNVLQKLSFSQCNGRWRMYHLYIYNEYVYEHGSAKFLSIEYNYFYYHSHGVSNVTSNNQSLHMLLAY